jgi:hypothetical protein
MNPPASDQASYRRHHRREIGAGLARAAVPPGAGNPLFSGLVPAFKMTVYSKLKEEASKGRLRDVFGVATVHRACRGGLHVLANEGCADDRVGGADGGPTSAPDRT